MKSVVMLLLAASSVVAMDSSLLRSGKWQGRNKADGLYTLTFLDNQVRVEYMREGGYCTIHGFRINAGIVHIDRGTVDCDSGAKTENLFVKEMQCRHVHDETDLRERDFLHCRGGDEPLKLSLDASRFKPGQEITIQGKHCLSMGESAIKAKTSVKFRSAPSVSATTIKIAISADGKTTRASDTIPGEYVVAALARTGEKERVQNAEDYWYFIEVDDLLTKKTRRGWVFGAFFEVLRSE